MARLGEGQAQQPAGATPASRSRHVAEAEPALERELLQAMADFERGDYIELTVEQLEHCAATGESPWAESPS
jgi:hypothetical protein